jgi:hypothetical protein
MIYKPKKKNIVKLKKYINDLIKERDGEIKPKEKI